MALELGHSRHTDCRKQTGLKLDDFCSFENQEPNRTTGIYEVSGQILFGYVNKLSLKVSGVFERFRHPFLSII